MITTNETVASASLWKAHVQSVLKDHQTFNAYVPLLGGAFWQGLAPDLQGLLTEVWAANIADYRAHMAAAQVAARDKLVQRGVVQEGLVKQGRMTPEIAAQALADGG